MKTERGRETHPAWVKEMGGVRTRRHDRVCGDAVCTTEGLLVVHGKGEGGKLGLREEEQPGDSAVMCCRCRGCGAPGCCWLGAGWTGGSTLMGCSLGCDLGVRWKCSKSERERRR